MKASTAMGAPNTMQPSSAISGQMQRGESLDTSHLEYVRGP